MPKLLSKEQAEMLLRELMRDAGGVPRSKPMARYVAAYDKDTPLSLRIENTLAHDPAGRSRIMREHSRLDELKADLESEAKDMLASARRLAGVNLVTDEAVAARQSAVARWTSWADERIEAAGMVVGLKDFMALKYDYSNTSYTDAKAAARALDLYRHLKGMARAKVRFEAERDLFSEAGLADRRAEAAKKQSRQLPNEATIQLRGRESPVAYQALVPRLRTLVNARKMRNGYALLRFPIVFQPARRTQVQERLAGTVEALPLVGVEENKSERTEDRYLVANDQLLLATSPGFFNGTASWRHDYLSDRELMAEYTRSTPYVPWQEVAMLVDHVGRMAVDSLGMDARRSRTVQAFNRTTPVSTEYAATRYAPAIFWWVAPNIVQQRIHQATGGILLWGLALPG